MDKWSLLLIIIFTLILVAPYMIIQGLRGLAVGLFFLLVAILVFMTFRRQ